VVVEMGGTQVVTHVGLHLLGSFADRLGLGDSLSAAVAPGGERAPVHDRGKVLTQAMLMLAGGGEACSDIEHLRAQPTLFGAVPSDSTLYRIFRHLDAATLSDLRAAFAEVRVKAWRKMAATTGSDPIVLDIDASLHEVHSENKAETAPHYKGGFGFIRSTVSPTPPASVSPSCCGRAMLGRTRSPITSPCSTRRSTNCLPRSPSGTGRGTTRACCGVGFRCAPIRPGAPTSCGAAASATSASP
jgi:hypothetical protein